MNDCEQDNCTGLSEEQMLTYILYSIADSINIVFCLPINVYVLRLIVIGERAMVVSDIFALNLTVSDMLTCVASLMFILNNHINGPEVERGPLWNTATFFKSFILAGRPLFQCCICLERYLAVVHPVTFLMYKPLKYRLGCCAVIWLLLLGSCIAYLFAYKCSMDYFNLVLILVLCSVMLFCCLAVLRVLKRPKPGDVEGDWEGTNNIKLRAFRIILAIVVSMVIQYLPQVLLLTTNDVTKIKSYDFGLSISYSFIVITGFVQPLLYLHRAGKLPCIKGT
ncbi:hypothetical protein UPYG_G00045130 [Umbra pygmaea]|uniref:G-protein coupled receptors family 1 profile domain-containing protein n=1 Tax=Umbra pygmaea TaxID=75934 RepID=A0ABD0Y9J8_UMBPY